MEAFKLRHTDEDSTTYTAGHTKAWLEYGVQKPMIIYKKSLKLMSELVFFRFTKSFVYHKCT